MAINLSLDENQLLLQQSVGEFLRRRCPLDAVRTLEESATGYSGEMWREMGGLGWLGITIPENYGGTGGTALDHGKASIGSATTRMARSGAAP